MAPYLLKKLDLKNGGRAEEMLKNIKKYVVSGQMDTLLDFCNCCLYKIFDERLLMSECTRCSIYEGITEISNARKMRENLVGNS